MKNLPVEDLSGCIRVRMVAFVHDSCMCASLMYTCIYRVMLNDYQNIRNATIMPFMISLTTTERRSLTTMGFCYFDSVSANESFARLQRGCEFNGRGDDRQI